MSSVAHAEAPPHDIEQTIQRRFEQIVAQDPARLALCTASERLSYGELNRLANRIAHAIVPLRTGSRRPVAIFMEQGAPAILAILASLKAGSFFVHLEPSNPVSRNAYILENSQADLVLTTGKDADSARRAAANAIPVLDVDTVSIEARDDNPCLLGSPDDLAYLIYTSGSTGLPKGVVQNHRNVLHFVARYADAWRISASDRQTLVYAGGVNGAARDTFNALLNGASLHVFPAKQHGPAGLAQWLVDSRITIWCSVTTVFRQLTATLAADQRFSSVRLIKIGGEAVLAADVDAYRRHFSDDCRLHCSLGMSETSVVTHFFMDKRTHVAGTGMPLGYPAEGMEVLLLDEAGREVAPGAVGEIVVRSRYVALGYWRNPELTQKAFAAAPGNDGRVDFRTGDLGAFRADGCLEYRGRKDRRLKIRGNTVEPAEVEAALLEVPGIKQAVAVIRDDDASGARLVAYCVPDPKLSPSSHSLRKAVAQQLPDFMVPSAFVFLDRFPLLASGKVDRGSLPQPSSTRPELDGPPTPPASDTEAVLAAIWSELLRIAPIGRHDNFLDLGGDSVLAARFMSRLEERLGLRVPLRRIFEFPTIAGLVASLGATQAAADETERERGEI
jgi:amino acid adenylation domain-containing protein